MRITDIYTGDRLRYIGDHHKRKGKVFTVTGQLGNDVALKESRGIEIEGSDGVYGVHFVAELRELESVEETNK